MPGPTLVDFEARSRCNLKKRGGRNYWADPSTEALCAVLYDVEQDSYSVWVPGDPPPVLTVAVSHDPATFDRFAADANGWTYESWIKSSDMAQRAGLPGGLDKMAARWLGGSRKDLAGNKLTLSLSRPSRAKATRGQLPEVTDEVREQVINYCGGDVEIMAEAWPRLVEFADVDADAARVDAAINDRGVYCDVELVRALQRELQRQQDVAVADAAERMGDALDPWDAARTKRAARSAPQMKEHTGLPNCQADTLKEEVKRCKAAGVEPHPLVLARTALASVIPGKLVACLDRVSPDNRIRDSHKYYGAHTGRWSSKGIQLHNLPRISYEGDAHKAGVPVEDYIEAAIDHVMAGGELTKRDVTILMRSVLCAAPGRVLSVWDYSGIEARVNAWAAGDARALDVFRAYDAGTGPDPYKVMAATIFSCRVDAVTKDQRGVGKAAELGCGYQMGPEKFDDTARKAGTDLAAAGVSPDDVVKAWRKLHAPIVKLWAACERAFAKACEGGVGQAGPCTFEAINGTDVACFLPSGRPIVYPEAKAKREKGRYGDRWALSFQGHKAWRQDVYGGLLVENLVQGASRDLLAAALVKLDDGGLDPVLHVHDEGVCEIDEDVAKEGHDEVRRIMADTPDWARGLPVKLDGFMSRRYRK